MGITISSKHNSCDMGYGGFRRFRIKVSEQVGGPFEEHYKDLMNSFCNTEEFYKKYNRKTENLIKNKMVTAEVANFCYQSDCKGSIDKKQAKEIYELIKDCDESLSFGYSGRNDCATMVILKRIFKDCTSNCKKIEWY